MKRRGFVLAMAPAGATARDFGAATAPAGFCLWDSWVQPGNGGYPHSHIRDGMEEEYRWLPHELFMRASLWFLASIGPIRP